MSRHYYFGEWVERTSPLTAEEVAKLAAQGRKAAKEFAAYPVEKVLTLLDSVGKVWANPDYEPRRKLEAILPQSTGFSLPMIQMGMQEVPFVLSAANLRKKLETSFGRPSISTRSPRSVIAARSSVMALAEHRRLTATNSIASLLTGRWQEAPADARALGVPLA